MLSKVLIQTVLHSGASRDVFQDSSPWQYFKQLLLYFHFCIFIARVAGNLFTPRVQINASSAIIIHPNTGKKHSAVFINLIHPGPAAAVTQIQESLCTESPELTQDYLSAWPVERAGVGH